MKLALGPHALADVVGDGGSAHYLPGWIPDRGDRKQDIDQSAVLPSADRFARTDPAALPSADRFARTDPAALPDGPEVLTHFVRAARRSENVNVLSDDFLARVTEQHFGAVVPTDDGAVQPFADDRVVRGFDDRGQ